jgi:hypothetical protein
MLRNRLQTHPVAETSLHEALTLVGFLLSYFALMGLVISSTVPFFSDQWSAVWPVPLVTGFVATGLIVTGLFFWPKSYAGSH